MRCRHCGKELALLKRLRGGGEFCSDAHRQSFQEEYNRLALSRLLQAVPGPDAKLAPSPASPAEPVPHSQPSAPLRPTTQVSSPSTVSSPVSSSTSSAAPVTKARSAVIDLPTPPRKAEAPKAKVSKKEDSAPAEMAGYLAEVPNPAMTRTPYATQLEIGRMSAAAYPTLPHSNAVLISPDAGWDTEQDSPVVELPPSDDPSNDEEVVPDACLEAFEIRLASHPPLAAGVPWLSPPLEFRPVVVELEDLARLDFTPDGVAVSETESAAVVEPEVQPEPPQAEEWTLPEPELAQPIRTAAAPFEPVRIDASLLESVAQLVPKGAVIRPSAPMQIETPVAEPPAPDMVTQALPVTLHGTAAAKGRVTQVFTSALRSDVDVQVPPSVALPLRPTMVFGPAPVAPVRQPEPKPVLKAEPKPELKAEPKPEPKVEPKLELKKEYPKRVEKPEPRPIHAKAKKVEAPAPVVEPPPPAPVREIPRVVERPAPQAESPASLDLGLPSLQLQTSAWGRLSSTAKIGLAAGIIVAISGIGYLVTKGGTAKAGPNKPAQKEMVVAPGLPIPDAGWIADWSPDSGNSNRGRRISMQRGTLPLSDYRLEFQAQIESKALGWVFRGQNPKNFYVTKLEVIKPGLEPTVALVHFAVINGREQDRVQVPLPLPVRVDTTYKIRFEAVGSRFTTWVQDQKIDEWNDTRIASGGAGLYSERGEASALQGIFNVMQLVVKN